MTNSLICELVVWFCVDNSLKNVIFQRNNPKKRRFRTCELAKFRVLFFDKYTLSLCIATPYPTARCKQPSSKKTAILVNAKQISFILLSVRQFISRRRINHHHSQCAQSWCNFETSQFRNFYLFLYLMVFLFIFMA